GLVDTTIPLSFPAILALIVASPSQENAMKDAISAIDSRIGAEQNRRAPAPCQSGPRHPDARRRASRRGRYSLVCPCGYASARGRRLARRGSFGSDSCQRRVFRRPFFQHPSGYLLFWVGVCAAEGPGGLVLGWPLFFGGGPF